MRFNGGFDIAASRERVWASFWDEAVMSAWLPGCLEAHWQDDGQRVTGEVEQSVAQLKARFAFSMDVAQAEEPARLRLRGAGRGVELSSDVELELDIRLEAAGPDATRVDYEMDAHITGKLALVGNFVLKMKTRELERQMAAQVKALLEGEG